MILAELQEYAKAFNFTIAIKPVDEVDVALGYCYVIPAPAPVEQ